VEDDIFVSGFGMYLAKTAKDTLLAAISRACVSTKLFTEKTKTKTKTKGANASEGRERGAWWMKIMTSVEKISGSTSSIKYRFDAAIMPDPQGHTRGFISSIYNQHKISRNEPSSSIFRVLSRYDEHTRPDEQTLDITWTARFGPSSYLF
jgi:hypothetical protein